MGHHRKGRSTRRHDGPPVVQEAHGSHRAETRAPVVPEARPEMGPAGPRPGSRPVAEGVSGRPLEDLAEAARTARRTGWAFGAEILASADTRGVPTSTPPPRDGRPRRYATHQPTAPIAVLDGR
ncbi:hypothetical protein [Actinomycetospora callitridis]|uniref:hypothetical protein n=1 Tax=Actinomycetospora callitridis TaxID=913944 RepID=UPI002366506C|nr:hypothetical protein [Actinomycetospora callitridis]MDD7916373.1 hypothetical protein [Actinomycetospora callitridis]